MSRESWQKELERINAGIVTTYTTSTGVPVHVSNLGYSTKSPDELERDREYARRVAQGILRKQERATEDDSDPIGTSRD